MAGYKRYYLLLFSILLGLFMIMKIRPANCPPNLKTVITTQRGSIGGLLAHRDVESKVTYYLDVIDFPQGSSLVHKTLGALGFSHDFFIDAEANLNILKPGLYTFDVKSDDGFRLTIDDTVVAEFIGDRPFAGSVGTVFLKKGPHHLMLNYYQGFGQLGLVARVTTFDGKKFYVGESSPYIEYKLWPKS